MPNGTYGGVRGRNGINSRSSYSIENLLSKYCPDRALFSSEADWAVASVHAHYIWYYFAAIALVSAIALIIYGRVVRRLDAKKGVA